MLWNAKNGTVALGNTEMDYAVFGHGSSCLILLPGLSDGLATVAGKAVMLAGPYRRYLEKFTIYMFSRKRQLPEGYTIREMAEDQAMAMERLEIEKASVMGVSQGGMIAQFLAALYPEKTEKLVLAVTAPFADGQIRACIQEWMRLARKGDHRALMIDTAEKCYTGEYLKRFRKIYPIIGQIGKPSDYRRFLINAEAICNFDAREVLDKIECPTLILGGETDQVAGVQASYALSQAIHGSELYIYPGHGHGVYEEEKDFNDRVFRFLGWGSSL